VKAMYEALAILGGSICTLQGAYLVIFHKRASRQVIRRHQRVISFYERHPWVFVVFGALIGTFGLGLLIGGIALAVT